MNTRSLQIGRFSEVFRQILRHKAIIRMLVGCGLVLVASGCAKPRPVSLTSPWMPRQQVWAIAPLANESGVSHVDRLAITDGLVLEVASIKGVDVLPLNRTLETMLSLNIGLDGIPNESDYRELCQVLNADAILVGTIIAYDPYQPLRFGSSLQLIRNNDASAPAQFDPRALSMSLGGTSDAVVRAPIQTRPIQSSGIFDTENYDVRAQMEAYSTGRSTHDLARNGLGLYHLDMDDYAEFVFHQLLERLLREAAYAESADSAVFANAS